MGFVLRACRSTAFGAAAAVVAALVTGACTSIPSYFPPCVYTAPCPGEDAGDDVSDSASPSDGPAAETAPEGAASDATATGGDPTGAQ